jgi:hypothetical protein
MQPISSLFKNTFAHYIANFKLSLAIIAVPAVLAGVAAYFEPAQNETVSAPQGFVYILFALLSFIAAMFMTIAIIHTTDDPTLSVSGAYKRSAQQFFKYLGFIILLSIILIVAFLLLIIPGIWLSISLSFAMFILLLQNAPIIESMKTSFNLVKGRWWKVFGRNLLLGLLCLGIIIVVELVSTVFSFIVGVDFAYALTTVLTYLLTPLSVAYMYIMFRDLQG